MSSSKSIDREIDAISAETDESFVEGKIFCANCIHCKLVPSPGNSVGQFYLRVRCDAGKWKKKLGEEKIYKYFTVTRRSIDCCDSYEPMGDAGEFISDLKRTLPIRDELYRKE